MTKLRRVLASLAVLALSAGAGAPVFAAEKVTFLIDWLPAGDKAVPYLEVQKGVFAEEGLDVVIQSGRGSSDVVTKLATGAADMGTGGLAALLQARAQSPAPVKAILSIYTLQPDAIFTTEDSGIATLKDVAGKNIATATFSSSNVVWPLVLKANGIDPAKVDVLKADPGALAPMLATGKVAGTINWVTVAPAFVKTLGEIGKKLKVIQWSDYGFDGYGLSLLASEKILSERPETAKKFVRAYMKANAMAIADPRRRCGRQGHGAGDRCRCRARAICRLGPADGQRHQQKGWCGRLREGTSRQDLEMDCRGAEHSARQARS